MFILLEVSDPSRLSIVPCDDHPDPVTVSEVGRGTLLDVMAACNAKLNPPSNPHESGTIAATKRFIDPDLEELDEDGDVIDEVTPLYESKPRAIHPISAFFKT